MELYKSMYQTNKIKNMKAIYLPIIDRLKSKVPALEWIDLEKGQLKKVKAGQKPPVKYPCALISIAIPKADSITDTIQDCKATITVRLAFDPYLMDRTSVEASEDVRDQHLEPYDVIADVYAALQGFSDVFDSLSRTSQGEDSHDSLFVYKITFSCEFEDLTAD